MSNHTPTELEEIAARMEWHNREGDCDLACRPIVMGSLARWRFYLQPPDLPFEIAGGVDLDKDLIARVSDPERCHHFPADG